MSGFGESDKGPDAFAKFWQDMMANMSAGAFGVPFSNTQASQEAAMKAMRQAFFDAWAKQCDEFLRSEAFLKTMKQAMDGAIAFKQQMNEFLTKAWQQSPAASQSDMEGAVQTLRRIEDQLIGRVEELSQRVAALERRSGKAAGSRKGGDKA